MTKETLEEYVKIYKKKIEDAETDKEKNFYEAQLKKAEKNLKKYKSNSKKKKKGK